MNDNVEVTGIEAVNRRVLGLGQNGVRRSAAGLYQRGEIIMGVSKERTPIEFGPLRASGFVEEPRVSAGGFGQDIEVVLKVGGPSAPYAVIVHEDLNAKHDIGQAKFLESAVMEAVGTLAADIAADLEFE